jgi:hypothetical protein
MLVIYVTIITLTLQGFQLSQLQKPLSWWDKGWLVIWGTAV